MIQGGKRWGFAEESCSKKAFIAGDPEILWSRYPALKQGSDPTKRINSEKFEIAVRQTMKLLDGNVFPESYERIKAKFSGDQLEVVVHGMELYVWDNDGTFDDTGGEIKLILSFRREGDQWTLFRTQDVGMP